jgi:hypothetical protein
MGKDVDVSTVQFDLGGAGLAVEWFDAICSVYDEVFSVAPFFWLDDESELHRGRLLRLLDDPTFGIVVAYRGDQLVGFAYGMAVPGDSTRWSRIHADLDEGSAREWPGRTFMLFDYAVRAEAWGQGVGRVLHDRLLSSRPEERATLAVQPTAVDTKRIYERLGWRMVGTVDGGPGAAAPSFDVYLRDSLPDAESPV